MRRNGGHPASGGALSWIQNTRRRVVERNHLVRRGNVTSSKRSHALSRHLWCIALVVGQLASSCATTQKGLQPVGAAASVGEQFQMTFDDEFDGDSINISLWNGDYANLQWCEKGSCAQDFKGIGVNNGILSLQATVDHENFAPNSGRADVNSGGLTVAGAKFSQRYGYFEWQAKLPHDRSGEGDGLWPALWALPIGKSRFPGGCAEGNEEVDVLENVLGIANTQQVHFTIHDFCYNQYSIVYPATPVGDLSAAYHTYGLYWRDDGSPHGSMQVYFDGVPQGVPYVLDSRSNLWDNGLYILNQVIPCPNVAFFGGSPCTSKTSSDDPLLVNYVRAWKEVPTNWSPAEQPAH
jgi:hypothetical protein